MIDRGLGADLEKTTLLGAVLATVTLLRPLFAFKENRVALGEPVMLPEAGGVWVTGVIAGLVLAAGLLSFAPQVNRVRWAKISIGMLLFATLVITLGLSGSQAVAGMEFARITPSTGFWVGVLASFVLVQGSLHSAPVSHLVRSVVVLIPFLIVLILLAAGVLDSLAPVQEYYTRESRFVSELGAHLWLSGVAVLAASMTGVPLGILAYRRRMAERPVFAAVNGIQTIPSLALFGLMIAPLAYLSREFPVLRSLGIRGIGNAPALIALTLYALLPVVRNAYTSLAVIRGSVIDAGKGMGMSRAQMLRFVEVPIAVPIILSGVRVSTVQAIGNTAVAALIGAGGLGTFVFQGLGQGAPDLVVMGVIPIVLLSVFVDRSLAVVIRVLTPRGLKGAPS